MFFIGSNGVESINKKKTNENIKQELLNLL